MAQALWVYLVTGKYGIPTVYKPDVVTRELRKLFSQYQLLNRQIRVLKNNIRAVLSEKGIQLSKEMKAQVLSAMHGMALVDKLELTRASELSVRSCMELLWRGEEEKGADTQGQILNVP
jgi:cytosine/adenosine deaminase-related metal-dependent hydrolase